MLGICRKRRSVWIYSLQAFKTAHLVYHLDLCFGFVTWFQIGGQQRSQQRDSRAMTPVYPADIRLDPQYPDYYKMKAMTDNGPQLPPPLPGDTYISDLGRSRHYAVPGGGAYAF